MGYRKHQLRHNKQVELPKKICYITPYLPIMATSLQQPLSSVPEVAIVKRFDCISFIW